MNWGQSINNCVLMFVGKGNNKDKGRNRWLRTEKETIRLINKSRSHFFGGKVMKDKKRE